MLCPLWSRSICTFAHDLNYTVESLAKLFWVLEMRLKSSSRQLFDCSKSTPLFEAVLHGVEMCETSLLPLSKTPILSTPLPPILNVQMQNAARDNKNWFVFYLRSLLIAKGKFREVYVNFMLVGHKHDDIDVLFGKWSIS
jgi:hypothetical protein